MSGLCFDHTFNPYSDRCAVHDRSDAPRCRSRMLQAVLEAAAAREIDAIWPGRDLGFRGGRRTGLALTDDWHLEMHGRRWGLTFQRPTTGAAIAERTAAVVWRVLARIEVPVFLWNVFPLHPHRPGNPFSNRPHDARARRVGEVLLSELLRIVRPQRLLAIGTDAGLSAGRLPGSCPLVQVRHPGYGGASRFLQQMAVLYGLAGTRISLV